MVHAGRLTSVPARLDQIVAVPVLAAAPQRANHGFDAVHLRKRHLFFEFSLCLSRACLGKMFVFMYKWRKNAVFSYPLGAERIVEAEKTVALFWSAFPIFVPSLSWQIDHFAYVMAHKGRFLTLERNGL